MTAPVVVIDNGTGFTKMGYAGNEEPTYLLPTCYADNAGPSRQSDILDDLDFSVGHDALSRPNATVTYPIQHGIVEDWDKMERIWQHCIYKYLRVEPSEYGFLLTEPPANPPENREYTAEVMFETFGVKQMFIAVQGVLALTASWTSRKAQKLGLDGLSTGTVIDSGDGVTHVIPIVDGYVIGNAIKHIPLAGRDVTNFVLEKLREREKNIPAEEAMAIAQRVKEQHCYICRDMAAEINKFDSEPTSHMSVHEEISRKTGKAIKFDVGYEAFLGPEIFFTPDIFSSTYTTPLPEIVNEVILSCPVDTRKALYKNIVLSGGTTMFSKFDTRLQRDVRALVDLRIAKTMETAIDKSRKIEIDVNVVSHERQRYAVWYGGSVFGASEQYDEVAFTKAQYEEHGPNICRNNAMFSAL
jgi:actin-related protein 3